MKGKPHDRELMYDGGAQNPAGSEISQSDDEHARRIDQRRLIIEDPELPHDIRGRAHQRMCELKREGNDE